MQSGGSPATRGPVQVLSIDKLKFKIKFRGNHGMEKPWKTMKNHGELAAFQKSMVTRNRDLLINDPSGPHIGVQVDPRFSRIDQGTTLEVSLSAFVNERADDSETGPIGFVTSGFKSNGVYPSLFIPWLAM